MAFWADNPLNRTQTLLFHPTLEEMVGENHPVRLFDELLRQQDWSQWELQYCRFRGQPPIHPRIIVGAILYGMTLRLTSSRQLEDACNNRLDFIWLVHGHHIDHSTFAKFIIKHKKGLESLFAGISSLARQMGYIELKEIVTDGTRIQANSSPHKTASKEEIKKWLACLEQQISESLAQMAQNDEQEDRRYGSSGSPSQLPLPFHGLIKRKELMQKAKQAVVEVEKRRAQKGESSPDKIAKVPVSDPDARVLPNKEAGFSPNYTPVISTDGKHGFIVDADVTASTAEAPVQSQAVDRIEEIHGTRPEHMIGDGLYNDLENVQALEAKGVTLLIPVKPTGATEEDVAYRSDPTEPVSSELVEKLPLSPNGYFTRNAFIFNLELDCFFCPMGKCLDFKCITSHKKSDDSIRETRVYKALSSDCGSCPLKGQCIPAKQKNRRVERMQGSEALDRTAERMKQTENQERFRRRGVIGETPFAHIKGNLGIRRFRHRGR
ncbi:IS1182 family transposase [candidate division CSSED10-310 bacterium]|uniref:IS1182 family transposase n=1 Tax=candidate division CSSED10-310 bacterium TaxID=2855610 RepID=A0ABV6Z6S5_UNCC1